MDSGLDPAAEAPVFGALVPQQDGTGAHAGPRPGPKPCPRPLAAFVAQLLANRDGAPAYRARRRASPQAASAQYGAVGAAPSDLRLEWVL